MKHFTAVLTLEFRANDHDAANDRAYAAIKLIQHSLGLDATLVNDQCEELDVSAADQMDDGAAR